MIDKIRLALADRNVQAFLRVIRAGEGTADEDGYRRHFGGELFADFSQHPKRSITKLLGGKSITSTAAGAYQFLSRTWSECQAALNLPDFAPASQDLAAVYLIARRKALEHVLAGRLEQAIAACAAEWASLPGSPYGQPVKSLAQCRAVYEQHGGAYGPAGGSEATGPLPTPQPESTAPAGDPTQYSQEGGMPLPALAAPFLMGLASSLIDVFTPLAKEKITKEMARHTDKPEVAEQIATTLVEGAKALTGKPDPVAAVAAARDDLAVVQKLQDTALADIDKLVPLLERLNAMEQANIRSAREYNAAEPPIIDTPWLKLRFVHLLSIFFVSFSGWFVTQNWEMLTPELRGSVIMLMMIAGWNGVRDYHMGSSSGSDQKTAMLARRSRTPAP